MTSPKRRGLAAAGALVGAAAIAGGCGSAGERTITVGGPALRVPAAQELPIVDTTVRVGPGAVDAVVRRRGFAIRLTVLPNRATTANRIAVAVDRRGAPVTGAQVRLAAAMLTMDMGVARYRLASRGGYGIRTPPWQMAGRWGLLFTVVPPGAAPIRILLDDRMRG